MGATYAEKLRERLTVPVVCAPMFLVSGPELVTAAAKAGVVAALPRQNARSNEVFGRWLQQIRTELDRFEGETGLSAGPIAANITNRVRGSELDEALELCTRYGVELVISAHGDPTELAGRVHDWGGKIFHDVTSMRFVEKAVSAGVDGVICIGSGGGGHSGTISHLAFVPRVREIFDGTIIMAGAVGSGQAVRAAEVLGADLAYIGTRFIATEESMAHAQHKQMIVDSNSTDLRFAGIGGGPANWLAPSLQNQGIDPDHLQSAERGGFHPKELPPDIRPWRDIWSAGQSIELIHDIPPVAEVVRRLQAEYIEACHVPSLAPGHPR